MLQTFPLNLLLDNARFYLSPSSGTPLGSRSNSYESLKDTSDVIFSTPSSSPRTPGPETMTSQPTFPSLTPPVTTPTAILSSLCTLPFPPSQTSLAPKPDPATPSLLDTSISFARMMDRTGSPASFLTCSSGWDPGIVCGAVTFPSLLHSRSSIENLHFTQDTRWFPSDSKAGAECPLWEAKSSQVSPSRSKGPFTIATPFYLSPSLRNAEFACPQLPDHVTPAPPRTALEPQLPSHNNKRSPISPQTASPGSEFSLGESVTSSVYDDPFHWDTILAGLPPSPQRSPALTVDEPLPVRLSTTLPFHSVVHCRNLDAHLPERDSMGSCASPAIIPTIVVLNPDSVMVPTQASVSSIIGLYDSRRESTQTITEELEAWDDEPEQELEEDGTDGEDSSPESEFEIVAAPALKIRLDTIFETDEMDVEGAFGSLMTLGSMVSGNVRISAAEEQISTEILANGRPFSSFPSVTESSIDVTSVFSSGQIVQSNPEVSASTSFSSTVKLFYTQSGTSISGESTTNSCHPTASGSESDCPWLFYVEDGKILEVPHSSSVHGDEKFADKLARFPKVPKSPQLTPLPSPFASPPPSPSAANPCFIDGWLPTPDNPKKLSGTTAMDVAYAGSMLSPYWERNTAGCPSTIPPGMSTLYRPTTSAESPSIAEITFRELDAGLGLSGSFGSLVSNTLPTDSSSSSGYNTRLSTAQSATPSYGRHVRFESADFRTSGMAVGSKQHSSRLLLNRSKTYMKKKRRGEKAKDQRNSSDASTALVRSPEIDRNHHLPSSFSSGTISKRSSWQHGRLFVAIGRVRRGIRGCLSSQEEETFGGTMWATERDYWNDHSSKGESKRPDDPMRDYDGRALLRRIRTYTR